MLQGGAGDHIYEGCHCASRQMMHGLRVANQSCKGPRRASSQMFQGPWFLRTRAARGAAVLRARCCKAHCCNGPKVRGAPPCCMSNLRRGRRKGSSVQRGNSRMLRGHSPGGLGCCIGCRRCCEEWQACFGALQAEGPLPQVRDPTAESGRGAMLQKGASAATHGCHYARHGRTMR